MKLPYISILRSLSILTVVAFHTYMYTYTGHFPASAERYREAYEWVNECVGINIAMPMFTLMAGYLFDYFYDKGKYRKLLPLLEKKAMRLLLPCFVFGTLMMATTGMAFEPWTLLRGGCQHLWYLPMLFWCFPLAWLVKRFVDNKWERTAVLAAFFFLSTLDGVPLPHVLGLPGITAWFGWFMLGGMIASHQEVLFGVIERYRLAVPLLLPFALQAWFAPVPYSEQNTWYSVLCTALALVGIVYVFANAGGGVFLRLCQPLVWLSRYSFGIYIFHYWIGPYMISRTAKRFFPLEELAASHIILFPLLLTIGVTAVSWTLTWLMMRTRVGRTLIGG